MGSHGPQVVGGDGVGEGETGRGQCGSCERVGTWENIYFITVLLKLHLAG